MQNKINRIRKNTEVLKLGNIVTKNGEITKYVKRAIEESRFDGRKIYCKSWTRSGRHINLKDHSWYLINLLRCAEYKFEFGNDAPKSGKEGDYIKVSGAALKFIRTLVS